MVGIINNVNQKLYSIDWEEGIVDITKQGVQFFIENPKRLIIEQPKGIKFRNEAKKMYEYLKFKNLL